MAFPGQRVGAEDGSQQLRGAIHPLGRGIIGQSVVEYGADEGAGGHIDHRVVAHRLVRQGDQESIGVAHLSRPEPHGFDHPIDIRTHLDAVAHLERLVDEHRHGTEEIGHRILCGQTEGQSEHRHRSEDRRDVDPEVAQQRQRGDQDQPGLEQLADEHHELLVERHVAPMARLMSPGRHRQIDDPECDEGQGDGSDDQGQAREVDLQPGGPIVKFQSDVDQEDQRDRLHRPVGQFHQDVVPLGLRLRRPVLESILDEPVECPREVEGHDQIDQRREVLPSGPCQQRFLHARDRIDPKRQLVPVALDELLVDHLAGERAGLGRQVRVFGGGIRGLRREGLGPQAPHEGGGTQEHPELEDQSGQQAADHGR